MGSLSCATGRLVPFAFLWTCQLSFGARSIRSPQEEPISMQVTETGVAKSNNGTYKEENATDKMFDEVATSASPIGMVMNVQNDFGSSDLGISIAARASLISGESGVGTSSFIHVLPEWLAMVREAYGAMNHSAHPCTIRERAPEELHNEVYRMVNNQLPLDSQRIPFAISYPSSVQQMGKVVLLAKKLGWKVYIVGGGHSENAWGFGEGIIISMLLRRSIRVTDGRDLGWDGPALRMEAGAIMAEAYAAAHASRKLLMGGSCATVGAVGYYLGGGFGYLSGSLGFGADNVLRFKAVTADGETILADRSNNPDLFNALRGGGHLGIVAVSDVWVKLHPWDNFGCVFRVQLVYRRYRELLADSSWVDRLLEKSPRALHAVLRSDSQSRFKISLTFLSDSKAPSRTQTVSQLAALLEDSGLPLPDGDTCTDSWVDCLLGTREKPTGVAHCSTTGEIAYKFDGDGDMLIPTTLGEEADDWGVKATVHDVFGEIRSHMYTDGFQHRSSTKTLLTNRINTEFLQAVDLAISEADPLLGSYISSYWFGGGAWDGNQADGSVADAHRPYSWCVIISSDFTDQRLDKEALEWTTRTWDVLAKTEGGRRQPHPNLYDRLHLHRHEGHLHETKTDGTFALGPEAQKAKMAKRAWDRSNLFHMPQGTSSML